MLWNTFVVFGDTGSSTARVDRNVPCSRHVSLVSCCAVGAAPIGRLHCLSFRSEIQIMWRPDGHINLSIAALTSARLKPIL